MKLMNKVLMHFEDLMHKTKFHLSDKLPVTSKKELLDDLPPYMYIVSEGIKTEPNYIRGFVDEIFKCLFITTFFL